MPRRKRQRWLPDNVTEYRDRHGQKRYRFRKTGLPEYHFRNLPGTDEFMEELRAAQGASRIESRALPYSVDDLTERLYRTPRWLSMKASSQYTYRRILDRYRDTVDRKGRRYGSYPVKKTTVAGLEKHLALLEDKPNSANNLRKALKRLFQLAVRLEWLKTNPAKETEAFKTSKEGWHTWTDDEIERYRSYWAYGTMARLTLELALNTAGRRCNLAPLERDHLVNGRWEIAHAKDNDDTSVAITAEARKAIDALPAAPIRFFITGAHGKPYTNESLGNRFRKWAREAGCPTNIHGLRKGVSRILAERGATTSEGRSITGHKNDRTFLHYAAKANRRTMADAAQAKLIGEPDLANPEK